HGHQPVGDVLLDEEDAGGGASLTGAVEGGGQDVANRLLRQGGGIDDHGVHAAGLGDEGDDRAATLGQGSVDQIGGLVGAGEGDAVDPRVGEELAADAPAIAR